MHLLPLLQKRHSMLLRKCANLILDLCTRRLLAPSDDFDHLFLTQHEFDPHLPFPVFLDMKMRWLVVIRPEPDLQPINLKCGYNRQVNTTPNRTFFKVYLTINVLLC